MGRAGWFAALALLGLGLGLEVQAQSEATQQGILAELNELDRRLSAIRVELSNLEASNTELETARNRHEDTLASTHARINVLRVQAGRRVELLYRLHRRGLARVIFGGDDPVEIRRRSTYLTSIVHAELQRLHDVLDAQADERHTVVQVEKDLDGSRRLRAELEAKQAEFQFQRNHRATFLDDMRKRAPSQIVQEQAGAQSMLTARLTENSTAPSNKVSDFRGSRGSMAWPTNGRIVRRFGPYKDPTSGKGSDSKGIDLAGEIGTPIRAVHSGVVALVDFLPSYGQTVVLEHGDYTTIYAHANGVRVRKGQRIKAGDVLGLVGNTGLTDSAGYMLTFEVRHKGSPMDPLPWLAPR